MTSQQILNRMLQNTDGQWDKSTGSWTYDVEKSVAIELQNNVQTNIDFIDKINVDNLTGTELTRFVFQRTGVNRVLATRASGEVIVTASNVAVINQGDLFAANNVFFRALETTNIPVAGQYRIRVEAVDVGPIGNVPVGAINSFPTTIQNISTVTNDIAFENGFPEETDESLRQRYYDRLQRPGKAGNVYHYREWAQSVAGVGKVKVFPRFNGPLTVRVAILDLDGDIASQQLIDSVFAYIEQERPFGANVTVDTGELFEIDISATFAFKTGYEFADVQQNIKNRIETYFRDIAFDEGLTYISQAQVGRELLSVEGIQDYSNLTLNGNTGNLPIGELQVPKVRDVVNV